MITAKRLERSIDRAKKQLAELEAREKHLSKHGYWEIGYFKGRISVLEDWLDEILENDEN